MCRHCGARWLDDNYAWQWSEARQHIPVQHMLQAPPGLQALEAPRAPPVPRRQSHVVCCQTMGLRFAGSGRLRVFHACHQYYIEKLAGERHNTPAENTIRDVLKVTGNLGGELLRYGHIAVDCRCFPDPDGHRHGGERVHRAVNHLGFHERVVSGVVDNPRLEAWMRKLRRRLAQEEAGLGGNAGTIFITFYCNSGRHRSVACALIMGQLLEWDGYTMHEPRHLCADLWPRSTCNRCHECMSLSPGRQAALQRAWELWHFTGQVQHA